MADSPENLRRNLEQRAKRLKEQEPVTRAKKDETVVLQEKRTIKVKKSGGATKDKNPLESVFDGFDAGKSLNQDLSEVIELEKQGKFPLSDALHYQLADTWAREAIYRHKNPQEVLDAISRIALIYQDNPTEFSRYKQLVEQVLKLVPDKDEDLQKLVDASKNQLDKLALSDSSYTAAVADVKKKLDDVGYEVIDYYADIKYRVEHPNPDPDNPDPDKRVPKQTLINPRTLSSPSARVAAVNINSAVEGDRLLLSDPISITKLKQREIDSHTEIPEADAKKLVEYLTFKSNDAILQTTNVTNDLKEYYRVMTEKGRISGDMVKNLAQRIEGNAIKLGKTVPPELNTLKAMLSDYSAGMDSATIKGQLDAVRGNPEAMALLGGNTADIETVINIRAEQEHLTKMIEERAGNPELYRVGITDKESSDAYSWALSPESFLEWFDSKVENDFAKLRQQNITITPDIEKQIRSKYFNEAKVKFKKLASQLLSVADAADDVFFEQLFSQFYHDPLYNNLVTGLDKIQSKLVERERKNGMRSMVEVEAFNYEKKRYDQNQPLSLTDALGRLQDEVKFGREWKKYTHNIYVLMLQRAPLETYKNYAASVSTAAVDMLMVDNPDLERAIRLHMSYVRSKYGLSNWKTPVESIYTPDSKSRVIPVDEYVRERLRASLPAGTPEAKIKELTTMARGYVLGISWESIDAMASGKAPEGFTGFFGPLDKINPNNYLLRRWSSEVPNFDHLFTRIHGKGTKEPWDVRREFVRSKEYQAAWTDKEPSRVVTDKMVEEGIPFLADTYYLGIGGIEMRWGWRKQMYEHLLFEGEGKGRRKLNVAISKDRAEIIKRYMQVNLSVANRQVEDWAGEAAHPKGWGGKAERNKLRKMVLEHMKAIAPQEFITLEKDLLHHSSVKKHWWDAGKPAGDNWKKADELMLDSAVVTDYLLENTRGDVVKTLKDLQDADWEIMFKDEAKRRQVREFMIGAQTAADGAIMGTTLSFEEQEIKVKGEKEIIKKNPKTVRVSPWSEAAYFKSFPTHLSVKRNGNWGRLKENVIGRMASDNDLLGTAMNNYWTKIGPLMKEYQSSPSMAKQEKFNKFLAEVSAVWQAYQGVHGNSADQAERASAYRISYQLITLFDKYFAKDWKARLPGGVGTVVGQMDPYASWAQLTTGMPSVLQMDEQNHRVLVDEAIKRQLVAPPHGKALSKGSVKQAQIGPLKLPWKTFHFDKILWNGAQLKAEMGATTLQVSYDVLRSYIPLVIFMIALSAGTKSVEDDSK